MDVINEQTLIPEFTTGYVAIVGWTNVGKSTLLNQLIGQKLAIVSPKPQTTRNQIMGIRTDPDSQMIFFDTPGFHDPKTELSRIMLKTALTALDGMDLICVVTSVLPHERRHEHRLLQELRRGNATKVLVINKCDLVPRATLLPMIADLATLEIFSDIVPVSALTGDNVDHLAEVLKKKLPVGEPHFDNDQLTDRSERFLVAELIREVLLERLQQEVPHCTTVEIEKFVEAAPQRKPEIYALIYVERESQKKIIIGKNGEALKAIGIDARGSISRFLGQDVVLKLWVKVRERWRSDPAWLRSMGMDR